MSLIAPTRGVLGKPGRRVNTESRGEKATKVEEVIREAIKGKSK
jgi:hypothetical protein